MQRFPLTLSKATIATA